ncbi:MAG TPA: right-handed parallel beta-helix repeat-containing protein [Anaerolineales bacterium]|nr:right-handed parallel beta-helix repeat-containing protein [Anaerolineales bacterium]
MWRKTGKITAAVLILAAFGCRVPDHTPKQVVEYYVSPDGSDQNRGTLNEPWRTLEHALGQLSPGDTLYLRGGTYYEHGIVVRAKGTASAPIVIRSYPGERAFIDGGVPYFTSAPNSEWELVDGDIHLYRSRRTFLEGFDFVRAWLLDEDVQLVEYESAANLESTNYGPLNGLAPFYMGPGLQLRRDGHIYIRLVYNPNDLTDASRNPIASTPTDVNPNNNSIAVFFATYSLLLDGASYIHFKDVSFSSAQYIMDVRNGSHHITLSGCRLNYGTYGLVIRENARDWEIHDCEFNNGVPDYIYWTDVKNRDGDVIEAYPEFQSAAMNGPMPHFNIHHNLFRNTFDGLMVEEGTTNTRITENAFIYIRDDAINLSRGISNVEVAHNILWHVMSGISNLGSDKAPGHVYIHHNIIDNSAYQRGGRPGNYREDNWPMWAIGSPFPDHDAGNKTSWWKLYNNTIVSRQDAGHKWAAAGPDSVEGNPEKYVFNNIFYIFGERVIFRNDLASFGSHYDGNVVYRDAGKDLPLFSDFGDGGRYYSLLDFQTNSGTGWEVHGLEMDPGFDVTSIVDPTFDLEIVWERYRPTSMRMFTLGASYDGLDWPETLDLNYRGAVPP